MARSTYIYVVEDKLNPVAAFTVKHELITWLRNNGGQAPGMLRRVIRLPDGASALSRRQPTRMDIAELIA